MSGFSDMGSRSVDVKIGWTRDGEAHRIPGLKSKTWGTQSCWNGQMWATRQGRRGNSPPYADFALHHMEDKSQVE